MKSRIGLAFLAIRENELEARAAGIDPVRYRLLAFALSAYLAGVAGALQIHISATSHPNFMVLKTRSGRLPTSYWVGLALLPARLSGQSCSRLYGKDSKAGLTFGRYVIVGVILILVIIFLPRGLVSLPKQVQEWWKEIKDQNLTVLLQNLTFNYF